ncbi:dnaJ homolog subfamily C member 4 isoform 1-T1 [Molossus nigricans]
MRMRGWGLSQRRKWRRRSRCPPAAMLPLLPLCLCRLWPRSSPTRLFAEAAGQRSGPSNYYELLGVHPGATTEEVKRAFFCKSKELHPDRDPGNPALHSRFVELSEAYQVLSREQSRRNYDHQLRSATPPKSAGSTAHPRPGHQAHRYSIFQLASSPPSLLGNLIPTLSLLLPPSSSWAPPNAQYWAQFHGVRPQGSESRRRQHRHNQQVLGYCLLIMLAGMGLHYVAFRKLEQMHRSFMDEKDRIITAIYNDTRARARANRARLQQEQQQRQQLQPPAEPPSGPRIMPR